MKSIITNTLFKMYQDNLQKNNSIISTKISEYAKLNSELSNETKNISENNQKIVSELIETKNDFEKLQEI